jgi:hypothetical protein
MKKVLTILFLLISFVAYSETYYVSTVNSSDSYDGLDPVYVSGTNGPWATWQKAFETAVAGDTVYFRGGVWYPVSKPYGGYAITVIDPDDGHGHNGTYANPICFFAYPSDYESGDFPILDCSLASEESTGNIGLSIANAEYLKFKGLTVRNVRMLNATHNVIGISGYMCSGYMSWENMTAHHIGGAGQWYKGYDTLYVTNCDVYACCDSLDINSPGGDGDGFAISSLAASFDDSIKVVYMTGCRAWDVTDDGFDIATLAEIYIDNCWAWRTGGDATYTGDGSGFKLSYSILVKPTSRVIRNCITAYNEKGGYLGGYESGGSIVHTNLYGETVEGPILYAYNNFSYKDARGYSAALSWTTYSAKYFNIDFVNNIVYSPVYLTTSFSRQYEDCVYYVSLLTSNIDDDDEGGYAWCTYGRAMYNPAYTLTDDDFISLDTAELRWARQADGSLPIINFGRLEDDSDLKGAGTDVGMSAVPDIGIDWEYLGSGPDSTLTGILTFTFPEQTGIATIDTVTGTPSVDIEVEYGTDASALTPTITLDYGATVSPLSGVETDFTAPVTYTVTALNGVTTKEYTVTVTVATSPDPPTVILSAPVARHTRLGYANANVTDDGGGTVSARGVCWSTSESPTTSDSKTTRGTGTGSYSNQITGLNANTTYYVRAYATNENGTAYSSQRSFTTPEVTLPLSGTQVSRVGNSIGILK